MNRALRSMWPVVILFFVASLAVACGEPETDSIASEGDDNQVEDQDVECAEDEYRNPVSNECQKDDIANDDDDPPGPDDCDSDEIWDDEQQECVDYIEEPPGPEDCEDHEIWDEGAEECIEDEEYECGPGSIEGLTCRPDGGILPGADVVLEGTDCGGNDYTATTTADSDGSFDFQDVPSGTHELTISSGSFETTDDVTVLAGGTTDLTTETSKVCLDGTEVEIAVFEGMFDDVGSVLDDMQIDYTSYAGGSSAGTAMTNLVNDYDELKNYDIIFVECQVNEPATPDGVFEQNIRRFVEEGNSIYASDRAFPWLERGIEEAIPFDNSVSTSTGTATANVVSPEMQTLLGTTTTQFTFDTSGWTMVPIDDVTSPRNIIHFSIDDTNIPGSSGGYSGAAVVASYDDPIGNGRVIYTSFHNSQQITGSMMDIMEFMIFQL